MTERLHFHFHFSLSCTGERNGNPLQCSCLEDPGTVELGGLPSMGSHRVGHNWSNLAAAAAAALLLVWASQVALVKNLPANAGDVRDAGSIPGLRRSPGEEHGNPLQYSFLLLLVLFIYLFIYFIIKLYIIVLVLPNIKMNPPQVYMCSPSWTLLPPPSLQYSCLENTMDIRAWWAKDHRIAKSRTRLKWLSMLAHY